MIGPDAAELRVLGCLIEKQRTTPDAYPLSLNALRLASNQSTGRDPVVDYDDEQIREAVARLVRRGWARLASGPGQPRDQVPPPARRGALAEAPELSLLARADAARRRRPRASCASAASACTQFATVEELEALLERARRAAAGRALERRPGPEGGALGARRGRSAAGAGEPERDGAPSGPPARRRWTPRAAERPGAGATLEARASRALEARARATLRDVVAQLRGRSLE